MKLLFLMDGTVITAVAEVLYEDGELADLEDHYTVIEVPHGAAYVGVYVNENGGIDMTRTFANGVTAGQWLDSQDYAGQAVTPVEEASAGHWCVTYDAGSDRESYGHVFSMHQRRDEDPSLK